MDKSQLTKNTNPQGEKRIRVKRKLRFANTDSELNKLHRQIFIQYCRDLEHDYQEIKLLTRLWDLHIDKGNIRAYINAGSENIYFGITHNCLNKFRQTK